MGQGKIHPNRSPDSNDPQSNVNQSLIWHGALVSNWCLINVDSWVVAIREEMEILLSLVVIFGNRNSTIKPEADLLGE